MWFTRSLLGASLAALSFNTASATVFDPHALQVPRHHDSRDSSRDLSVRNFDPAVKWTDWTAGDGVKEGSDGDKVWYIKDAIKLYLDRVPPENRNGVFWAGGATTEDDFDYIDEFIESPTRLDGTGVKADQIYPITDFQKMGLDGVNKDGRWWRAINRMSKALAASASGDGIAYVYLKPVNCRTIFSPPSHNPMDNDPTAGGRATNGEIWYYAELPTLMRNLNIKQIVSFHKNGRKFQTKVEWDAEADAATHPRTMFDDIAMDASPIVLPPEAGRPPLRKRTAIVAPFANSTWTTQTISTSDFSSTIISSTDVSSTEETEQSSETSTVTPPSSPTSFATVTSTDGGSSETTASVTSNTGISSSTEAPALPGVTVIDGTTVISGGHITEPVPVTETETIDPSGTEATSSAQAIQTELDDLFPLVEDFIDNPSEDTANDSDDDIDIILPVVFGFLGRLTPDPSPAPCSSPDLITSLFNAVSCVADNLNKLKGEIEAGITGGFGNMPAVVGTLGTLQGLKEPLKNENNDEDQDDDDDEDEDEDETSTAESSAESTTEASSTESCTAASTVSDCHVVCPTATESVETASCSTTCHNTMTGCDVEATTSTTFTGGACPLPTDFTSEPEPQGPFRTAWFDSGLSCAGDCAWLDTPSSFPVDEEPSVTATDGSESTTGTPSSTGSGAESTTTPSSTSASSEETTEATSTAESTAETTVESEEPTTVTSATDSSETTTFVSSTEASTSAEGSTTASLTSSSSSTSDVSSGSTVISSSPATTTAPAPTGPFPCHHRGGPNVATPYCQCSTETEGQTFFATVPLTDHVCAGYSTFPEAVTPTAPTGPYPCHHRGGPRVETPHCQCTTETLGQTFHTTVPTTHFVCAAYSTYPGEVNPTPTQVSAEDWQCDDAKDSCRWAMEQYDDDQVYTEEVARLAFEDISGWDWFWDGDRGCVVNFLCEDYGEGMSGREIKGAVDYMRENDGVGECGQAKLSNTCEITVHFCMEANGDCYFTPNYGQEG